MYDPAIGRFTGVDPIAEQYAFVSGFNYAENDPVAHIDLHGLQKADYEMFPKVNLTDKFKSLWGDFTTALGFGGDDAPTATDVGNALTAVVTIDGNDIDRAKSSISELGGSLQHYGDAMKETSQEGMGVSIMLAGTPASPLSPTIAKASGITGLIGSGMVLAGEYMENGSIKNETLGNFLIEQTTRGASKKLKGVINETSILGQTGNTVMNNILKSSVDGAKIALDKELKDD